MFEGDLGVEHRGVVRHEPIRGSGDAVLRLDGAYASLDDGGEGAPNGVGVGVGVGVFAEDGEWECAAEVGFCGWGAAWGARDVRGARGERARADEGAKSRGRDAMRVADDRGAEDVVAEGREELERESGVRAVGGEDGVGGVEFPEEPRRGFGDAPGVGGGELARHVSRERAVIEDVERLARRAREERLGARGGVEDRRHRTGGRGQNGRLGAARAVDASRRGNLSVRRHGAAAAHDNHRALRAESRLVRSTAGHHPQVRLNERIGRRAPLRGLATHRAVVETTPRTRAPRCDAPLRRGLLSDRSRAGVVCRNRRNDFNRARNVDELGQNWRRRCAPPTPRSAPSPWADPDIPSAHDATRITGGTENTPPRSPCLGFSARTAATRSRSPR